MRTDPWAIDPDRLPEASDDPFLRHHVDPEVAERAWVRGRACVVDGAAGRPGAPRPTFTALGPAADLGPLMAEVAGTGAVPRRLSVEVTSLDAVPAAWRHRGHHRWHWMVTHDAPPATDGGGVRLALLDERDPRQRARIEEVIDDANPDSFARPGLPRVETWLGGLVGGELVGVAALLRMHDGSGHVRGVSVRPAARGRGVGAALSADATRRGLVGGPGVVTLGVYTDNVPALAIYAALGYRTRHTFASGPTVSAEAP